MAEFLLCGVEGGAGEEAVGGVGVSQGVGGDAGDGLCLGWVRPVARQMSHDGSEDQVEGAGCERRAASFRVQGRDERRGVGDAFAVRCEVALQGGSPEGELACERRVQDDVAEDASFAADSEAEDAAGVEDVAEGGGDGFLAPDSGVVEEVDEPAVASFADVVGVRIGFVAQACGEAEPEFGGDGFGVEGFAAAEVGLEDGEGVVSAGAEVLEVSEQGGEDEASVFARDVREGRVAGFVEVLDGSLGVEVEEGEVACRQPGEQVGGGVGVVSACVG